MWFRLVRAPLLLALLFVAPAAVAGDYVDTPACAALQGRLAREYAAFWKNVGPRAERNVREQVSVLRKIRSTLAGNATLLRELGSFLAGDTDDVARARALFEKLEDAVPEQTSATCEKGWHPNDSVAARKWALHNYLSAFELDDEAKIPLEQPLRMTCEVVTPDALAFQDPRYVQEVTISIQGGKPQYLVLTYDRVGATPLYSVSKLDLSVETSTGGRITNDTVPASLKDGQLRQLLAGARNHQPEAAVLDLEHFTASAIERENDRAWAASRKKICSPLPADTHDVEPLDAKRLSVPSVTLRPLPEIQAATVIK